MNKSFSNFLFPDYSFISGAGTVINLAGNFYDINYSKDENEADQIAMKNDFAMVGQDIREAINSKKELLTAE